MDFGRIGLALATGGITEAPGLVDKYITHGSEAARNAGKAQHDALDAAMKRLQEGSALHYQNRMKDLEKTMAFYGPAQRYLESIYGGEAGKPMDLAKGPPTPTTPGSRAPMPSGFGAQSPTPPGFPKMGAMGQPGPPGYAQGPRRGY